MKFVTLSLALMLSSLPLPAEQVVLDAATQSRAGILVRPVLERSFGTQIRVVGQVVRPPGGTIAVQSVLSGRVEHILARPGDSVKAGDPLVELHSHALLTLQGEVLQAAEAARLAKSRLQAGHALYELAAISRLNLETREQDALAARLRFDAARAELVDLGMKEEAVRDLMSSRSTDPHLILRAPEDGVVLELPVQEHQWVREYDVLVVVGDPDRVELQLQIPPDQAAVIGAGDIVDFAPVGRPDVAGRAHVVSRVPEVDPTTRTVRLRASIDKLRGGLFPGVFVEGSLTHGEARTSPSVPESAVIRLGAEDVVFIRLGPETYESRPVQLGQFNGSRYEILGGVAAGEEVAVQGVFLLKSALVAGAAGEE